jgi:hypothetical protein
LPARSERPIPRYPFTERFQPATSPLTSVRHDQLCDRNAERTGTHAMWHLKYLYDQLTVWFLLRQLRRKASPSPFN